MFLEIYIKSKSTIFKNNNLSIYTVKYKNFTVTILLIILILYCARLYKVF